MPSIITHDTFGQDIYRDLFTSIGGSRDEAEAFLLGNQGPDPLFYSVACPWLRANHDLGNVMHDQLPANFAIASAARCPSVYFSVAGLSEILLSASKFRTSSSVISCWMSLRTSFRSFRFSFIRLPLLSGIFFIILRSPRRGQAACLARAAETPAAKQENARRQKTSGHFLTESVTAYSFWPGQSARRVRWSPTCCWR